MSDRDVQPSTDPSSPSPGTPACDEPSRVGEGQGGGLLGEPDIVDLAIPVPHSGLSIPDSAALPPPPPRRTFLQRFTTSRASTLTSLLLALALHAALLSLAYIYHI